MARMKTDNYKKLRLQEFNDFDMERLLKGVTDSLEKDNESRLRTLEEYSDDMDPQLKTEFAEAIENNAAEIVRVSSILTHTDDVYSYFTNGPLFRKDRDAN